MFPLLGFVKGDYAPREGRKGRVIVDDPSKYPGRDELGLVGGWAGGEAALQKLRDEIKVVMIMGASMQLCKWLCCLG